ncbi:hypothetical protein Herbaro_16455 [Herbaspirillum sp. WKF16]|jgi:hypothetical protein|uniref:hypothetical protein n=1 Tax=Herbaspirillum sp. WKF16 TaxID=3028312 RepID=UPI0023A9A4C8|nr:hypothetical protein [Herbaspirillum sp. WKF16]WDZ95067.1 hypothetical protein Herbaro_16455 [Herbaspirillum sp. WKF16]
MKSKLKLLGALMVAGAFSTGALAQTAATPPAGGDAAPTKAEQKAAKKAQKKQKRDQQNQLNKGAGGPPETSGKPLPAAGTGSQ